MCTMPGEMSKGKTLRIHICIVLTDCSVLVYYLVNSALRVFDPCKDKHRKIAWKNTQELLMQLINILQCGTDDDVKHLRENIQQAASPQRAFECLHLSFPGMTLVLTIPYIPKLNKHLEMLLSDRDSSPLYRHSTMTETDRN